MIIVLHDNKKVVFIDRKVDKLNFNQPIIKVLYHLSRLYSDEIIVWSHISNKSKINLSYIKEAFHLKNMMFSYSLENYFPGQIGYIEDSPFINVNKTVKYPTWQMSSNIGCILSSELLKYEHLVCDNDFNFALCSIAKLGMPNGLFCYSDNNLLI